MRKRRTAPPPQSHLLQLALALLVVLLLTLTGARATVGTQQGNVVNVGASVAPNPYNVLALELRKRDEELLRREQDIAERERAVVLPTLSRQQAYGGWVLTLFLLVVLGLHLYVDRKKKVRIV